MADDQDEGSGEPLKDPRSTRHDAPAGGEGDKAGSDKDEEGGRPKPKKRPVWPLFLAAAVVLVFVFAVLLIVFAPHGDVRTDDAYVTAHFTTVAPRVSGQVSGVYVNDNQPVRAGQLLATLDPRDYQTALRDAEAALQSDEARRDQAAAEVARQPAIITQAAGQVASADARLDLSSTDARRYANLAATGADTAQRRQQADTALRQDRASLVSAEGELASQRRQLAALQAAEAAAAAQARVDQARIDQARLNLSYTRLVAPFDGSIDQRTAEAGDYVAPGAALMTVVPLEQVFILANYREVALRHMAPGQHVRIHVDAYNIDLDGVVNSIPPASGATYSPVPPNNATGNFTKIVQRLPVKITLVPGQPRARLLRLGMSVETVVHTGLEDVAAVQQRQGARVGSP
jgi:membrane fusion protein, multidrug efflux system